MSRSVIERSGPAWALDGKRGAGSEGILGRSGNPSAEGLGRTAGPAGLTPGRGGWAPGSSGCGCREALSLQLIAVDMPASLLGVRHGGSRRCGCVRFGKGVPWGTLWEAGSGNQAERLFTRFPL